MPRYVVRRPYANLAQLKKDFATSMPEFKILNITELPRPPQMQSKHYYKITILGEMMK